MFTLTVYVYYDLISIQVIDNHFHPIEVHTIEITEDIFNDAYKLVKNFITLNAPKYKQYKFKLNKCSYYFSDYKL